MKRVVFSTKFVDSITQKMDEGYMPSNVENPYFDKKIGLRKEKIPFRMTAEEQEEYIKCKIDVKYFANNYCKVKVEDGTYQIIKLRDYQYEILDMFQNPSNKFNVLMASRQIGKCLDLTTKVLVKITSSDTLIEIPLYELYFKYKKDRNIFDRVKYLMYRLIDKLNK